MSRMLLAVAFAGEEPPDCRSSIRRESTSRIRIARVPSARVTASPGVTTAALACRTRASATSRSRTMNTSVAVPGSCGRIGMVWCGTFWISMISTVTGVPRDPRRLMTLFRAGDVEHVEQARIRRVVRPLAGCRERRHLHAERVAVERERAVHVLDEAGERPRTDHGAAHAGGRLLNRGGLSGQPRFAGQQDTAGDGCHYACPSDHVILLAPPNDVLRHYNRRRLHMPVFRRSDKDDRFIRDSVSVMV